MFEYAIGHWLQKSTEHIMGCVLCSPGCFSLFRGKALMDQNIAKTYTTVSDQRASPRCAHRVLEPWTGETWFFQLGCSDLSPTYSSAGMRALSSQSALPGLLADHAAPIRMKVFYGEWMGRWGLLAVGTFVAAYIAQWNPS